MLQRHKGEDLIAGILRSIRQLDMTSMKKKNALHNQLHLLFMGMDHIDGGSKSLKIDSSHFSPAMKEIPDLNGAINTASEVCGI